MDLIISNVMKIFLYITFACQCGRFRYARLPFRSTPAGDMLQRKIEEIFRGILNVFGVVENNLVVGYNDDGAYDEKTKR